MHPDIEKLIDIAKESGELTDKQREIIIRKAKSLGADVDEVEMLLETIKPIAKKSAPKKCPRCGAVIPALSFKCPDCGFLLENESQSTQEARSTILDLQKQLSQFDNSGESEEIKAALIQAATIPQTIEGLSQRLTFACSNYKSTGRNESSFRTLEKEAWLAKAKDVYSQLQLRSQEDSSVQSLLNTYSFILNEKAPIGSFWVVLLAGLGVVILYALIFVIADFL